MEPESILSQAQALAEEARDLAGRAAELAEQAATAAATVVADHGGGGGHADFFLIGLTVFVLAVFVGYYVVWNVTPALHSPLMSVTNAVSSVIIVGALIAAGPADFGFSPALGFVAVVLASVNIFGGFIVTQRMLQMYKKKKK